MKKIFLICVIFSYIKIGYGQIIYDLPKQVSSHISKIITDPKYASSFSEGKFAFYIKKVESKYYLSKIESSFDSLITQKLIKETNRFIRINQLLIPLIIDLDIMFAHFGDSPPRTLNGKTGKKKMFLTVEHYLVIFDDTGKIY